MSKESKIHPERYIVPSAYLSTSLPPSISYIMMHAIYYETNGRCDAYDQAINEMSGRAASALYKE